MSTEKKTQKKILDYLKSIGAYSVKSVVANRNGVPDIIACYKGYFIAVEVKDIKGGVVTDLQQWNIGCIQKAGGVALVARDLDTVKEAIAIIDKN